MAQQHATQPTFSYVPGQRMRWGQAELRTARIKPLQSERTGAIYRLAFKPGDADVVRIGSSHGGGLCSGLPSVRFVVRNPFRKIFRKGFPIPPSAHRPDCVRRAIDAAGVTL